MNEHEFAELAAGHALHALTDEDEERYARALREHPEWSEAADADAGTAALLGDAVASVTPPPALRAELLAEIATTPQAPATPQERGVAADAGGTDHQVPASSSSRGPEASPDDAPTSIAPRRRPTRLLFVLAACLALLVGIGVGAAVVTAQLTRPASVVALEEIENAADAQRATVEVESGVVATAHWSASAGRAVLVTEGLEELDDERTYELWFVRAGDAIPAGLFDAQEGTTTALLEGEMQAGDVIAVTIEPSGGSPTGAPTSDPILAIPTA